MDNNFTIYPLNSMILGSIPTPPPIYRDIMRKRSQKERRKKERYQRSQGIRIRR